MAMMTGGQAAVEALKTEKANYVFGLIGLLMNILSDMMYVFIDPRIDFESRRT